MAAPAIKFISLQDYLAMEAVAEEKHEYFEGQVVAMAGAKEAHIRVASNLMREIGVYVKGSSCDVFAADLRVSTPSATSYMYPDLTIICGDMEKKNNEFDTCTNPVVVIEIMSETTRDRDMGYKFFYYQQIPSLKEYILIDSTSYHAVIIRRQADDSWKFINITDTGSLLEIQTIGLSVSLADIYAKVSFA